MQSPGRRAGVLLFGLSAEFTGRMMRTLIIPIALIAVITQVHASAGASCRAEDASVKFGLSAAFTRGLGGGMVNFGDELKIQRLAVPADLGALNFDRNEVSQVRYFGRDLKFQLHHKPPDGPLGYADLVVETTQSGNDESLYCVLRWRNG